jgi:hypothetical protein
MEHTTEDARALMRAAKEVHAERHGDTRSYLEPTYPFWKRQDVPVSGRTVSATTTH